MTILRIQKNQNQNSFQIYILHNSLVLIRDLDSNLFNYLKKNSVYCSSTFCFKYSLLGHLTYLNPTCFKNQLWAFIFLSRNRY
jgi:hypothetical protein